MILEWTYAAQCGAAGLAGVAIVAITRYISRKRPIITFPSLLTVFLTSVMAPAVPVFITYPFLKEKPDLSNYSVFLIVAAFGIVWIIYRTIKQATE